LANDVELSETDFLRHVGERAPQMMWFLGAGTSRSAGLPTAWDITWDLKRKYYCLHENQDLKSHDVDSPAIRQKIQAYMDSKSFPSANDPAEYSFYFEKLFGEDHAAQQNYLAALLDPTKISLNSGHRALAGLIEMRMARVIFTTNFDVVIETAYAEVAQQTLNTFHLEGSYAALEALNAERFPIYAKLHGDFRFQSVKNLSADLLHNDQEIMRCFLAAADRYGLIVSGYSGRDANVMKMMTSALNQSNAFPHGLFWTVSGHGNLMPSVETLIETARAKGIRAQIVEAGTFDTMLSRIWRSEPNRPDDLDKRVRTALLKPVNIPLPPVGKQYPVLRTNALAITEFPRICGKVEHKTPFNFSDLKAVQRDQKPESALTFTDNVLFWGSTAEINSIFGSDNITVTEHSIVDPIADMRASGAMKGFFEHGLALALVADKPLFLRRKGSTYFAVVDHQLKDSETLRLLKDALGGRKERAAPGHW